MLVANEAAGRPVGRAAFGHRARLPALRSPRQDVRDCRTSPAQCGSSGALGVRDAERGLLLYFIGSASGVGEASVALRRPK
jgi:hypothetical protein